MHLITSSSTLTMSSLEIADLVSSRHDKVKQSIERLAERGVISLPPMGEVSVKRERREESVSVYNLCKRDSLIVVAQLCPEFTAAIVDRWQELEAQQAAPQFRIPQTMPEALRLAADLADERDAAQAALAIAAPKAEALDRIATADGSLCLMDAAKQLQMRPKDLITFLSAHQWIYKRAGGSAWIGYQDRIQAGLIEHKSNIVIDGNGIERIRDQVRVTAKGLARLAQAIEKEAA